MSQDQNKIQTLKYLCLAHYLNDLYIVFLTYLKKPIKKVDLTSKMKTNTF